MSILREVPLSAFVHFEVPVPHVRRRIGDEPWTGWQEQHLAPPLHEINRDPHLADVYWGWNEDGFYVLFNVEYVTHRPVCDPRRWWKKDGVRLCIATRPMRDVHRANRYCHFFYALPHGGRGRPAPVVGLHKMGGASEPPPKVDLSRVRVVADVWSAGYALFLAIPAECLFGFDPVEHPRISVFFKIRDSAGHSQCFGPDDKLRWNIDPSTWPTARLEPEE